jgi:hypothetical protein
LKLRARRRRSRASGMEEKARTRLSWRSECC